MSSRPHPPAASLPLHRGGKQAENKPGHVTVIRTIRYKPSVVRQKQAHVTTGLGSLLKIPSPTGDGQRGVQPPRQNHAWLAGRPAQHQDFRGSRSTPAQLAGFCLEMPRPRGQHHHGGSFVEPCCLRLPSRYAPMNQLSRHLHARHTIRGQGDLDWIMRGSRGSPVPETGAIYTRVEGHVAIRGPAGTRAGRVHARDQRLSSRIAVNGRRPRSHDSAGTARLCGYRLAPRSPWDVPGDEMSVHGHTVKLSASD